MKAKDVLFAMTSMQKRIFDLEQENGQLYMALHEAMYPNDSDECGEDADCGCDE